MSEIEKLPPVVQVALATASAPVDQRALLAAMQRGMTADQAVEHIRGVQENASQLERRRRISP